MKVLLVNDIDRIRQLVRLILEPKEHIEVVGGVAPLVQLLDDLSGLGDPTS